MSYLRPLPQILSALWCLGGCGACLCDDIYRTVDALGNMTYSDRAISPASRKVTVDVVAANPENAARLAKEQAMRNANEAEQDKDARQKAADQQHRDAQAAAHQRLCAEARSRYAMFAAGGRIWKADAQGNRAYYSDQEIEAERIQSKADMDSACAQ